MNKKDIFGLRIIPPVEAKIYRFDTVHVKLRKTQVKRGGGGGRREVVFTVVSNKFMTSKKNNFQTLKS